MARTRGIEARLRLRVWVGRGGSRRHGLHWRLDRGVRLLVRFLFRWLFGAGAVICRVLLWLLGGGICERGILCCGRGLFGRLRGFGLFRGFSSRRGLLICLLFLLLELGYLQKGTSEGPRHGWKRHTLFLAAASFSALTRSSSSAMME